ncbi:MAG: hypothetical protein JKY37_10230 [Nannocystaceae bacterium]|nr:hypothetical protein [Nannocystaceae bacterium]
MDDGHQSSDADADADADADQTGSPDAAEPVSSDVNTAQSSRVRGPLRRVLHVTWALALASVIVAPNLPASGFGPLPSRLSGWMRPLPFAQSWRMYAPNPGRSHTYMNLAAHYPDGRIVELQETLQEREGWSVTWAGNKSRVDIWRHYANFRPKKSSAHRTWYLRAVCIREARKGEIPTKIVMTQVRRRFTPPGRVAKGKRELGARRGHSKAMAWMPCKTRATLALIEADRARRGKDSSPEAQ